MCLAKYNIAIIYAKWFLLAGERTIILAQMFWKENISVNLRNLFYWICACK